MSESKSLQGEDKMVNDGEESSTCCTSFKSKIPKMLKIDKGLIAVKFSFFFTYAALGSYMPYFIVFLISIGLSATEAGFIIGLKTIVSLITGLAWGVIVDKTGKMKIIHLVVFLCYILVVFSLPWIAAIVSNPITEVSNFNQTLNYTSYNQTHNFTTQSPTTQAAKAVNAIDTVVVSNGQEIFYVMTAILCLVAVFESPLQGILDSLTCYILSKHKRKANYGMQRAFGGLGLATGNLFAGFAADLYSVEGVSAYTGIFYVFLFVGISFMFVIVYIYHGRDMTLRDSDEVELEQLDKGTIATEESAVKKRQKPEIMKPLIKVFSQLSNILFFTTVGIIGFAHSINYAILYLYMADDFQASKSMMGLATFVACTSELVIFPISSKIISFFKGPWISVIIGLFAYSLRYICYSYAQNIWIIICLQSLHMFSFGLFWSAAVEHTRFLSTEDTLTTMFMILNVAHTPLGNLIGNIMGGYLYDKYRGRVFFLGIAILLGVWAFLMLFYNIFFNRSQYANEKKVVIIDDSKDELKALNGDEIVADGA